MMVPSVGSYMGIPLWGLVVIWRVLTELNEYAVVNGDSVAECYWQTVVLLH
jgi:hypothetical protein